MPPNPRFRPSTAHTSLGDLFYDPVAPARFPAQILRHRDQRWAARIGLDALTDEEWLRHFALFEPLPGSLPQPLALRYHGHQFRIYNADLGDGRGFLFAQLRDLVDDRLLDLDTKGTCPPATRALRSRSAAERPAVEPDPPRRVPATVGERESLEGAFDAFAPAFTREHRAALLTRLGLAPRGEEADAALEQVWWSWLQESKAPFERAFFDWHGGACAAARAEAGPEGARYRDPAFAPVRRLLDAIAALREALTPL